MLILLLQRPAPHILNYLILKIMSSFIILKICFCCLEIPCYPSPSRCCQVSTASVAWLLRAVSQGSRDPGQRPGVGPTLPTEHWVRPLLSQWVGGLEWTGVSSQGQWSTQVSQVADLKPTIIAVFMDSYTKKHSFSFKNSDGNGSILTDKQYCFINSCIKHTLYLESNPNDIVHSCPCRDDWGLDFTIQWSKNSFYSRIYW